MSRLSCVAYVSRVGVCGGREEQSQSVQQLLQYDGTVRVAHRVAHTSESGNVIPNRTNFTFAPSPILIDECDVGLLSHDRRFALVIAHPTAPPESAGCRRHLGLRNSRQ